MPCSYDGCGRKCAAKGYCHSHYMQAKKGQQLRPIKEVIAEGVCDYPGCGRPHAARGSCDGHYQQIRAGMQRSTLRADATDAARFVRQIVISAGGCWLWDGHLRKGYGAFRVSGKAMPAHRFAFAARNGRIPEGLLIDHICRTRSCVRPSHLRLATTKQNAENRGAVRGSATGVRGVTVENGKYRVHAMHNGAGHYGGHFSDLAEADRAARALRASLFTHALPG
ncbi:HNH endonuclease signature motif containing protein [Leucobacter luti]|uniref:HNH endonuclease n=1 Tax=Leucobacter luti TaxID=340320 RepID=A0A4Q7U272_9MICO|nr:HNH endonuclease [Leucobacter luti]RZT66780.1 HNH endonuclease [Leucobacter luti]